MAVLLTLLCLPYFTEAARAPVAAGAPTLTEKFLLEQIAAGKVADLNTAFPDENARVIRAVFLEELLTGSRKDVVIHRNGVLVEGAIVREVIDLRNTEMTHDIRLMRCRFEGGVNFSKSIFADGLSLEESVFQGASNFEEMKIGRGFSLRHAAFKGSADFDQLDVAGVLQAGGVSFEQTNGLASFNNLKVGGTAWFTNASFAGAVDFRYSRFASDLRLDGARFTHPAAFASFEGLKVEGSTSFLRAQFAGYASLKDSTFNALDLAEIRWPEREYGEWLWLNGAAYQRISAGQERSSWREVIPKDCRNFGRLEGSSKA